MLLVFGLYAVNSIIRRIALFTLMTAIFCGRPKDVMEKECAYILLAPLLLERREGESEETFNEARIYFLGIYGGCMNNAKRFGTKNRSF